MSIKDRLWSEEGRFEEPEVSKGGGVGREGHTFKYFFLLDAFIINLFNDKIKL
jgi:hypothetical protein